eukprot:Awhi_evm1s6845
MRIDFHICNFPIHQFRHEVQISERFYQVQMGSDRLPLLQMMILIEKYTQFFRISNVTTSGLVLLPVMGFYNLSHIHSVFTSY